ncbi:MAG: type II toxin-antitoxin system RelE/ParE family toxin [Aestuariivirga sp.]
MKRFRVRLSARAEEDLIDIWFAIAADSPANADRFLDRLNERIDSLADFPERGASRPEIGKGVRFLVEGNHLILYRAQVAGVEAVRIVHGARELRDLVQDRKDSD